jgi:hypothetical protein
MRFAHRLAEQFREDVGVMGAPPRQQFAPDSQCLWNEPSVSRLSGETQRGFDLAEPAMT